MGGPEHGAGWRSFENDKRSISCFDRKRGGSGCGADFAPPEDEVDADLAG
jgi:hypothetical protein